MEMEKEVKILNLDDILPNRFQPRIQFNESAILELSDSIKEHGVIQPIVVRKIGDKYEIIAGERRYKASVLAGKKTIPAIITSLNDKDSAEVALIENVQRENLTPIEEAISYKKILDMGYLNQVTLADKLGKTQSTIANKIRLLNLADDVQEALLNNKISERHARSLLKLDEKDQIMMLNRIITERLTVRKTDEEIKKLLSKEENSNVASEQNNILKEQTENIDKAPATVQDITAPTVEEILSLDEEKESTNIMPENMNIPTGPIIESPLNTNLDNQMSSNPWFTNENTNEDKTNVESTIENLSPGFEQSLPAAENQSINPGFMDVEKIENTAQDIFKPEEKPADLDMLLNPGTVAHEEEIQNPMAPAVPPKIDDNVVNNDTQSGKFFNMFNFPDNNDNNQSNSDLEKQETNMTFTSPQVNDTFMFNFNPLENNTISQNEEVQTINSTDTFDNVDAFNPTIINSASSNNDASNEGNLSQNEIISQINDSSVEAPQAPTTLQNMEEKSIESNTETTSEPAFEPFTPYALNDNQEFSPYGTQSDNSVNSYNGINDFSNDSNVQVDMPAADNNQAFNFREVVKELRACNERLQQLGYTVDMEELDLQDIYQATFKISKM